MNLRVVNANIIVSIKSFYREKTVVFFRIAFPVILILVFGTIFMERDNEIFDLDIQDLSRTKASAELVKAIGLSKRFKIYPVAPGINARQFAKDKGRNLVLVIPKDYERLLMQESFIVLGKWPEREVPALVLGKLSGINARGRR